MAHLTITAACESCAHSYRCEVPAEKRSAARAQRSNADIWAQTHRNLVGHARFLFTETTSEYRIFGRNDVQMSIDEDANYALLGSDDSVEHPGGG